MKCPASFFTCFWWYTELGQVWRWWQVHWTCSVCFFNLGGWGGGGVWLWVGCFCTISMYCQHFAHFALAAALKTWGSVARVWDPQSARTHTHTLSLSLSYTSGCPWPSATVKSPGFFKLGSRFSFFLETFNFFIFLFLCVFYYYYYYYFVIIQPDGHFIHPLNRDG